MRKVAAMFFGGVDATLRELFGGGGSGILLSGCVFFICTVGAGLEGGSGKNRDARSLSFRAGPAQV